MTAPQIPEALAKHHGGDRAVEIGLSWAATFEVHGGLSRDDTVLDIGCGAGRMAIGVGERFGYANPLYLGFDITKPEIEWCTQNITSAHPNFQFLHLDIWNSHYNPSGAVKPTEVRFPAEDGSFDFIFATSIFTHIRTREMLVYLAEAKRCLAPGGTFFATYCCLEEEFRGRLAPDRAFYDHQVEEHCWTSRPHNPEDALGYDTTFVLECFERVGFGVKFYRGGWSKLVEKPTGRHGQDYVVATL